MDVQIGADEPLWINRHLICEICTCIKHDEYETGGIIGVDEDGIIKKFQFDKNSSKDLYEYYPNTVFLEYVVNTIWANDNIKLAGIIHSHFNNDEISQQDIYYAREIIKANSCFPSIIIGIINQRNIRDEIKWYRVNMESVCELKEQ